MKFNLFKKSGYKQLKAKEYEEIIFNPNDQPPPLPPKLRKFKAAEIQPQVPIKGQRQFKALEVPQTFPKAKQVPQMHQKMDSTTPIKELWTKIQPQQSIELIWPLNVRRFSLASKIDRKDKDPFSGYAASVVISYNFPFKYWLI